MQSFMRFIEPAVPGIKFYSGLDPRTMIFYVAGEFNDDRSRIFDNATRDLAEYFAGWVSDSRGNSLLIPRIDVIDNRKCTDGDN